MQGQTYDTLVLGDCVLLSQATGVQSTKCVVVGEYCGVLQRLQGLIWSLEVPPGSAARDQGRQ